MTSTKYIGYVGGVAVAVGVGAALAAAGTAQADTGDSGSSDSKRSSKSSAERSVNTGPEKPSTDTTRPDPVTETGDRAEDATTNPVTRTITIRKADTPEPAELADEDTTPAETKPSPEEFEAEQVTKLRSAYRQAAVEPELTDDTTKPEEDAALDEAELEVTPIVSARTLASAQVDLDGPTNVIPARGVIKPGTFPEWNFNPFRPEDPAAFNMPVPVLNLQAAILNSPYLPEALVPFVREGVEFAYRASQMVPWVNVVVPISEILPQLTKALSGEEAYQIATQVIINELLLTTQPVSFLFYGYDMLADFFNVEHDAQVLKQGFYTFVWDLLDPFQLLHLNGRSGLEDYPGLINVPEDAPTVSGIGSAAGTPLVA